MLKRLSFVIFAAVLHLFILLAWQSSVVAQEATLIDDVNRPRCDLSEVPSLDYLSILLQTDNQANGLIVLYGFKGRIETYTAGINRRLNATFDIKNDRFKVVYGGYSDSLRMLIWLIPKGAKEPEIKFIEVDKTKAVKFENYVNEPPEIGFEGCKTYRDSVFRRLANEIKNDADAAIYLVVHFVKDDSQQREITVKQAQRQANKDKSYLARKFKIERKRIMTAAGISDEYAYSEIWIVPKGAKPPQP